MTRTSTPHPLTGEAVAAGGGRADTRFAEMLVPSDRGETHGIKKGCPGASMLPASWHRAWQVGGGLGGLMGSVNARTPPPVLRAVAEGRWPPSPPWAEAAPQRHTWPPLSVSWSVRTPGSVTCFRCFGMG